MQVFVRAPGHHGTILVDLVERNGGAIAIAELVAALEARLGIPAHEQLLTVGGRLLAAPSSSSSSSSSCSSFSSSTSPTTAAAASLAPEATVDLCLRLRGGKGGFGALLRGQGRDGKITDNFDACRDLQGRRLRTVEAEKKLKEWAAQSKERELEKLAERHIRDLARQQRKERDYELNVEAVRGEQREAIERVHEAVQSALAEGLAAKEAGGRGASGSGASGSGAHGGSSSSDTAEERAAAAATAAAAGGSGEAAAKTGASSGKRKPGSLSDGKGKAAAAKAPAAAATAAAEAPGPAAKRQKRGGMLDMLEGSDDDESGGSSSDDE